MSWSCILFKLNLNSPMSSWINNSSPSVSSTVHLLPRLPPSLPALLPLMCEYLRQLHLATVQCGWHLALNLLAHFLPVFLPLLTFEDTVLVTRSLTDDLKLDPVLWSSDLRKYRECFKRKCKCVNAEVDLESWRDLSKCRYPGIPAGFHTHWASQWTILRFNLLLGYE